MNPISWLRWAFRTPWIALLRFLLLLLTVDGFGNVYYWHGKGTLRLDFDTFGQELFEIRRALLRSKSLNEFLKNLSDFVGYMGTRHWLFQLGRLIRGAFGLIGFLYLETISRIVLRS